MPYFNYKVPEDYKTNERLDKYIASIPGGMNRSKLKSGVSTILINGRKQKLSCKIKANDEIFIEWEDNIPEDIEPENIPLEIIYEDDNVCVINKPQGMVTHPACGNWNGTLVNALLFHWNKGAIKELKGEPNSKVLENRRPGIVHRLDKDTSGIIITAKNRDTEEFLSSQFRNHKTLTKEYIAITKGRPQFKSGVIKTKIARDPKDRKKFRAFPVASKEGKYAETKYKCIACYGEYSLFKLRIKTGRTHQIRVHLKYLNCPILGDEIYSRQDKNFPNASLMLNASMLKISIPGKNTPQVYKTKTPERFLKVMRVLQNQYKKTILEEKK